MFQISSYNIINDTLKKPLHGTFGQTIHGIN